MNVIQNENWQSWDCTYILRILEPQGECILEFATQEDAKKYITDQKIMSYCLSAFYQNFPSKQA